MRHILSIAIILCLLILVAVFFLSDSDPEITEPSFDLAPEQPSMIQGAPAADQGDDDESAPPAPTE